MGIFSRITKKTKYKAVFCGLDSSGKTTIISFLKEGRFVEHTPTMGKTCQNIKVKGTQLTLFDMGGQSHFRKMWLGEIGGNTKCVVFVIDRANPERFEEAKAELDLLVPLIKKQGIKLLLFANKTDLPNAVPIEQIYRIFSLQELDSFEILEISAKTGFGMVDAFIKFFSTLTGEVLKKSVVASAISIYNRGGVPIIVKSAKQYTSDEDILQGGFLSAITHFAQAKMGNACVKFESQDHGTYIIKSSEKFIGALLWDDQLSLPIEESEEALNELLAHLEHTVNNDDPKEVSYFVNQYATNLF